MLGQNHAGTESAAIRSMAALANPIEAITGSDDPCVRGGSPQILAEIFEYGGRFWRQRSKVVDGFVGAGGKTRGRYVVTENAAVNNLSEESALRDELAHQVGNVFLTFRGESLLIASTTAEGDDYDFSLCRQNRSPAP